MSKPPADWDEALVTAGLVDPRNGRPSRNQLALKVGMSSTGLNAIIDRRSTPKVATIQKIADALGIDVRIVSAWVGQERTERDPYAPPAEADLLTDRQRRAVDEIIRAIVAERASDRNDEQGTASVDRDAQPDGLTALNERPWEQDDFDMAAKRGRNRGREARQQQDRAAEDGGA